MGRVHVCSTIDIPTYKRLATFARERGLVHPTSGDVNTSDAVRRALELALGDNEAGNKGQSEDETTTRP